MDLFILCCSMVTDFPGAWQGQFAVVNRKGLVGKPGRLTRMYNCISGQFSTVNRIIVLQIVLDIVHL